MNDIKLIVFDVDGTLAETDDFYVEKGTALVKKVLPFLSEQSASKIVRPPVMLGETLLHGFYRLLDIAGVDGVLSGFHKKVSVKSEYKYTEVAGMRQTLEILSKKYKTGIITSGSRHSTAAFIEKFELKDLLGYVISAEDCKFIKPHPMPLLEMIRQADVKNEQCLMVGDTVWDALCARRAGTKIALVRSGFDSELLLKSMKADFLLDTVNDLPAILDEDENAGRTKIACGD